MNLQLLRSKKFRTAVLAAVSSLLTFFTAKFGLALDPQEVITLITVVMTPFLIYIGAEGISEISAKKEVEKSKARKELSDSVINQIIDSKKSE